MVFSFGNKQQESLLVDLERLVTYFISSFLYFCNPVSDADVIAGSKKRLLLLPHPTTARTTITSMRIAYLASISHEATRANKLISKRDVYYLCRALFPKETIVDTALKSLAAIVNVERNELSIIAAVKGLVAGRISFVEESGCRVDVSMFGPQGCLIPARPERITDVVIDAIAVLVYVLFTLF